MKRLNVELQNCYGIRSFKYEFEFEKPVYAIYASNGSMKSSFAQTLLDYKNGAVPKDRYYPSRTCHHKITDETGADLHRETIIVIRPYDDEYERSKEVALLLLDKELKKEYAKITKEFNAAKKVFLDHLKETSKSKMKIEQEISLAFMGEEDKFNWAITRVKSEVKSQKDLVFGDVVYDEIFNQTVVEFLSQESIRAAIKDYIETYNTLLERSTYFKKGIFNFYNAESIAKALEEHGFFVAEHTVQLGGDVVNDRAGLQAIIEKERTSILSDAKLREKWMEIDAKINQIKALRGFYKYLTENEPLLPHLEKLEVFKQNVWKSYFKKHEAAYLSLVEQAETMEVKINEIQEKAKGKNSLWEEAVRVFNERFLHLPFRVEVANKAQVALGHEKDLKLGFTFSDDDGDPVPVVEKDLVENLSQGEKKALYILNLIFEIETRKYQKEETLFIIDDIADSFDYKNKFAIIEYLKDMSEEAHFKQIILTHNFDFFRTITSRNIVNYSQARMTFKTKDGVRLEQAKGIHNVFVNSWKDDFFKEPKTRIACIPFIRNIVEYTKGEPSDDYLTLTKLVHWMDDSERITENDLGDIFARVFNVTNESKGNTNSVLALIEKEAKDCLSASEGVNFENKIVLSIATRIAAEKFMVSKISNKEEISKIKSGRTPQLLRLYKDEFGKNDTVNLLARVGLITPENIHLNSFMYEPILDMSDATLKNLYKNVSELK